MNVFVVVAGDFLEQKDTISSLLLHELHPTFEIWRVPSSPSYFIKRTSSFDEGCDLLGRINSVWTS